MKRNLLFIALFFIAVVSKSQVIEDGVYVIKSSVNPNYVIDLSGSQVFNGNNIQIWERNRTDAQHWIILNKNGYVVIRSYINSQYTIDLNSSNAVSGENIHCWEENGTNAQRWILERVGNVKVMKL